jgi:hypothetical protein
LKKRGLRVALQVPLPVVFDGEKIELGYRIDLIVELGAGWNKRRCWAPFHLAGSKGVLGQRRLSYKRDGRKGKKSEKR